MIVSMGKKILAVTLCCGVLRFSMPLDAASMVLQAGQNSAAAYEGQGTPLSAEELQGLVAPVALYPDALVAQILSAATYPDQVAIADYWLQENKSLTGNALMQAVNKQSWDPSVKALTQFPSVLDKMAQSLTWTSSLGEAFHNQQADVMAAIQTLRAKAKAAGNLKSGPQIKVVQQSPQIIVIEPANPQIIYVPVYNPTVVYGTPVQTPGYSTADMVATGLLSFGAGLAVGAMMSGGGGWGYSAWHCNWYGGAVAYHGAAYYGNAAWHGGYYGDSYYHGGYYGGSYNNYYHNGNYNTAYNNEYHNNSYNNSGYSRTGETNYNSGNRNTTVNTGNTYNMNPSQSRSGGSSSWGQGDRSGQWGDSGSSRGWGSSGGGGGSSAFSGWGSHSDGGWGSRSASSRGWGSSGGWGGRSGGGWGGRR